ncbi:hypothetical protein H920_15205 [Fukomys damarensis]|uniref:Uncharacterized protein n=1 Tax=Fukomys damarensis TaxID=885580 RepID=A0A091CZT5_FUKDA|nr:hypothetical protein H920_15205 [Fukomys damarensis]
MKSPDEDEAQHHNPTRWPPRLEGGPGGSPGVVTATGARIVQEKHKGPVTQILLLEVCTLEIHLPEREPRLSQTVLYLPPDISPGTPMVGLSTCYSKLRHRA